MQLEVLSIKFYGEYDSFTDTETTSRIIEFEETATIQERSKLIGDFIQEIRVLEEEKPDGYHSLKIHDQENEYLITSSEKKEVRTWPNWITEKSKIWNSNIAS